MSEEKKGMEFVREESIKYSGKISEGYELLGRYLAPIIVDWSQMKKTLFQNPPVGALTLREKELITIGMQMASRFPNMDLHTTKAMEAGATAQEVAEVAALAIIFGGMMTYVISGEKALRIAEDYENSKKSR
jgi:alkylhydroperoxidase/carboxymuconolactone decarboxylase family protein YurZ